MTEVHVETEGPLLRAGTQYTVTTPEGPTLRARIIEVEAQRRVRIAARRWPFRSELECEIVPVEDGVQLVRRQTYPGLFGALWTLIARKRERHETEAYLDIWSQWASRKPSTPTTPAAPPGL